MDPLSASSLATNAGQLAGWTLAVLFNLFKYYRDVLDAPLRSKELREEFNSLIDVLLDLQATFEHTPAVQGANLIHENFQALQERLGKLFERTDQKQTDGLRRFCWPFGKAENEKLIKEIGRVKANLSLSVQSSDVIVQTECVDSRRKVNTIDRNVTEIKDTTGELLRRRTEMLDFLCSTEIDPLQDQTNYHEKLTENTAIWFRREPKFLDWTRAGSGLLWIHGRMGVGKSVLASSIISDLLERLSYPDAVPYFYCDGKCNLVSKREPRYILGSVLRQLFEIMLKESPDRTTTELKRAYEAARHTGGSKLLELLVQEVKELAAKSFNCGNLWIIVDGIDECPKKEDLCKLLRRLATLNIKVLVISRFERDIEREFSNLLQLEISEEITAIDIETHLKHSFKHDPKLKRIDPGLRRELRTKLLQGSAGGFRLVQCQIDELKEQKRDSARRALINRLPKNLPETYKNILDRATNTDDLEIGRCALTWLLYAVRPLRLPHLATAASIDPCSHFSQEQRVDEDEIISDICGSLIKINDKTRIVELSHISVKQYLMARQLPSGEPNPYYFNEADGNALLMNSCFMYLASPCFQPCLSEYRVAEIVAKELRRRFKDTFSYYAVFEWVKHALEVKDKQPDSLKAVHTFFRSPSLHSWRQLWGLKDLRLYQWRENDSSTENILSEKIVCEIQSARRTTPGPPVYYASEFGLESVVMELLDDGVDTDAVNEFGGPESYPLHVALENRNTDVATLLLDRGADINSNHKDTTALHRAIERGDQQVVQLLVSKGADIWALEVHGLTPLHLALRNCARNGVDTTPYIRLLASELEVKDVHGKTPLHSAAEIGHVPSVSILLELGANVDVQDNFGCNPLHLAARNGHGPMVDLLLGSRCNRSAGDRLGYTPLHHAVRSGNSVLAEKLSLATGHSLMTPSGGSVVPRPYV